MLVLINANHRCLYAHDDTLASRSNPVKKKLYDAYATNTTKPDNMSYAEWESRQVEIPKWLERILRVPGGGIW